MTRTSASARRTARRGLARRLEPLKDLRHSAAPPQGGWVRAIREALGMSAAELAARLGSAETSVLSLERNEVARTARLDTLGRAAEALNCDLVYALVPRQPLEEVMQERARTKAASKLSAVSHSMALEDQRVHPAALEDQLRDEAARLVDRPGLWRDA